MSWSVQDATRLEQRGIPTVTICSAPFLALGRAQAEFCNLPSIPFVKVLHPMATASRETIAAQASEVLPRIAEALVASAQAQDEKPRPAEEENGWLEVQGGAEEINELFHSRGWTDGLPVIPPTEENVRAMLLSCGNPDEELGRLQPAMNPVTPRKVAINAVMAGCVPAFFPVVMAAVEGLLDEDLALYSMQTATNATAPLLICNGPLVTTLCLNSGGNVFGPGNRANATIGRAVRLVLRNVGGEIPGVSDPSTHGQPGKYTFCIAEAEEESPWEPLHVERGYAKTQSTVTLIGAGGPQNIFTYGCQNGREVLDTFVGALCGLGHNNIIFPTGPLFVFSPEHANTLARDGFTKEDVKRYLFERARIPLARFCAGTQRGIRERRARWFELTGDSEHIGVADRPEDIVIVVAGGPGIHSQFLPTAFTRRPVTKVIREKR
ncbi:MAG TPA: UGSC family (seleno)protein [Candidatus Acidoferrales bacterium]|nr:UGSC family (seleno)protein [Candidatus Acidoferrales bacterium]